MEVDAPRGGGAVKATRSQPWVEKYRPDKVTDISHQDEVVRTLQSSIETGNLPHLMFHGPPGTGKTTTILAVARALFGPELYRSRILELNASDERGIAVVREKIKNFAQGAVGTAKVDGYPCPRFKLIILDEADTMTADAQSALRRVMETYSKVTRFCLICNYVTRIIEPLASRCAKFRFKPLPVESMAARLAHIASCENVVINGETMDALMAASKGDMRKAVTFLQSAHQLSLGGSILSSLVYEISGQVPPAVLSRLWTGFQSPSYDGMATTVADILLDGYPTSSILHGLQDILLGQRTLGEAIDKEKKLSDSTKALICEKIAQCEKSLLDGGSEVLQLQDLGAFVQRSLAI